MGFDRTGRVLTLAFSSMSRMMNVPIAMLVQSGQLTKKRERRHFKPGWIQLYEFLIRQALIRHSIRSNHYALFWALNERKELCGSCTLGCLMYLFLYLIKGEKKMRAGDQMSCQR